ncbi:MAG TPA: IS110 family transposase [Gemmatimonadaceae bacterium]|nr:IS110 family transposase [Gemmatimonadaceae bacterium]
MQSFAKRQRAQSAAAVVGVDAGKFKHALIVRPRGGRDSRAVEFPTTRAGFDSAVERILALVRQVYPDAVPAEILVGIEFAGSYGFTFAHYLHGLGFPIVNVLPSDTKRWKEVTHHQALKTDAKDALGITDLASQGHFVSFAFLEPAYAELRYLVSTRERCSMLRRATITRLKSTLELVWPEFERLFAQIQAPTPVAILEAYPGPAAFLAAPKRRVVAMLRKRSRNHLGEATYARLRESAEATLGLPLAQGAASTEVPLLVEQLRVFDRHLKAIQAQMARVLEQLPETEFLLTIPGVATATAATFLGCVGDVRAYDSSRQILRLAGLSLVEASSGTHKGKERISKRGQPVLRRHAYIFALRAVSRDGLFRAEFDAMVQRNGGVKIKALAALSRQALKILYTVARERRPFVAVHEPGGTRSPYRRPAKADLPRVGE